MRIIHVLQGGLRLQSSAAPVGEKVKSIAIYRYVRASVCGGGADVVQDPEKPYDKPHYQEYKVDLNKYAPSANHPKLTCTGAGRWCWTR